jgi:hypothetical protein
MFIFMGRNREWWFLDVYEKRKRVNMENGIFRRSIEF